MADEQDWHPVFDAIVAEAYYKPKFALALLMALDAEFDPQKQTITIDPSDDCDAISKSPVAGLVPPVMISVSWDRTPVDLEANIGPIAEACSRNNCPSVLVIMPLALDVSTMLSVRPRPSDGFSPVVTVWGFTETLKLVKSHVSIVTRYVPHLTPLAVRERLKVSTSSGPIHQERPVFLSCFWSVFVFVFFCGTRLLPRYSPAARSQWLAGPVKWHSLSSPLCPSTVSWAGPTMRHLLSIFLLAAGRENPEFDSWHLMSTATHRDFALRT
jgi:hypothetical protein